jgi:HK97 family phage major capsid protein
MRAEKDTYPLSLGDATFRLGTQNTATTASDLATHKVQLDASSELVAEVDFSYHLSEDAVIALVPEIRRTLSRNAAEALDNVCLNGDTTNAATGNINLDDADPADDSMYLIWDGLRHLWLVDVTANGTNQAGAPTADMFIAIMALMDKYAASPTRLAAIMDVETYLQCLKLDEVITVDKFGARATILNGQLASIWGIPIIVSSEAGKTEADGKISDTAASNTKGQVTIVHRDMWRLGTRRQLLIEADRDIQKRQHILVVSLRPAFNCWYGASADRGSADHTAGAYNITV